MGNSFQTIGEKSPFHWEYTEEPHRSRRIEILKKYPEIKKFMKSDGDRSVVFLGIFSLALQFSLGLLNCYIPYMPVKLFLNCCIGCWVTTVLMMHAHEAAHGLVFGPNHIWKNRLYGLFVNLGIGMPFYSYFKKFHKKHHKHIGDEVLDIEYPTEFEAYMFPNTPFGKYIYFLCQPFIYACRMPGFILKRPYWYLDFEEIANTVIIFVVYSSLACSDYAHIFNHLSLSLLVATASNMFGFWGMVSHIEFFHMKETSSYYGWMNIFYLNFGYHVEHHDFPNIPSRYLPQVREIAAEFYDDSYNLDSFHSAIVKFTFDSKMGIFSRLKRENKEPWKYRLDENENYRKFTK